MNDFYLSPEGFPPKQKLIRLMLLRSNCILSVAGLILLLLVSCNNDQPEPPEVGAAMVNITPPTGYPFYSGTNSIGVKDSLYAKALVFKQGDEQGALLICDLIIIERDLSRLVRDNASQNTGIPFQNITIAATHTHHVPHHDTIAKTANNYAAKAAEEKLTDEDHESYISKLIAGMTEAIVRANEQLQEVELKTGIGNAPNISFNRRYLLKTGRVLFNPGNLNPLIVEPVGPNDPDVHFVLFKNNRSDLFNASLTVFASHYAGSVEGAYFSADYPYYLHQNMKNIFGDQIISIFGAGACGDINTRDQAKPASDTQARREKVAKGLSEAIKNAYTPDKHEEAEFKIRSKTVCLPLQDYTDQELKWAKEGTEPLYPERPFMVNMRRRKILDLEQIRKTEAIVPIVSGEPWMFPVEIHAIQLTGNTIIITMPGELFVELGLDLKKRSPYRNTMIIELANSAISYIPTLRAFREGDYEPLNSRLSPGSGEIMVEEALALLQEIKK